MAQAPALLATSLLGRRHDLQCWGWSFQAECVHAGPCFRHEVEKALLSQAFVIISTRCMEVSQAPKDASQASTPGQVLLFQILALLLPYPSKGLEIKLHTCEVPPLASAGLRNSEQDLECFFLLSFLGPRETNAKQIKQDEDTVGHRCFGRARVLLNRFPWPKGSRQTWHQTGGQLLNCRKSSVTMGLVHVQPSSQSGSGPPQAGLKGFAPSPSRGLRPRKYNTSNKTLSSSRGTRKFRNEGAPKPKHMTSHYAAWSAVCI